jgi:primosomal protein N' (replication factor Y) (superfamily II helicase)
MKEIVEVAVGLPIAGTFHYRIPEKLKGFLEIGMRILVPFKGRKVTGFTLDLSNRPPPGIEEKLQEVEDLLDGTPLIDPAMLRFYRWISDYYVYPLGEVIKTGLPPGLDLQSEPMVRLTEEGSKSLARGGPDPIQGRLFQEIEKNREVPLKRLLKLFPGEITRGRIDAWKNGGLLAVDEGIQGKEVRPKFERVIRYIGGEQEKSFSGKSKEILEWIRAAGTVSYADLRRRFKSASVPIRSLLSAGLIAVAERELSRDLSVRSDLKPYPRPELTQGQEEVLTRISRGIHSRQFSPFLLHGVTGSGKTEVYLRAIEEVLAQGREAIVLVPEISLTPLLLSRFMDRFGKNLALLHSGLGKGERFDQWRKVLKGEVSIAVGARSAIFAPFRKLGLIIVDEEHDPSYKQDEKLKYHARDLAVVRAKQAGAALLLGSATPSLESYYNAEKDRFHLLRLPERIGGKPLPRVEVVDMRKETGVFSEKVKAALQKN